MLRNLFLEFGEKALGIPDVWLCNTKAYRDYTTLDGGMQLLQAGILAYASSTWLRHRSALLPFIDFCYERDLSIFESTPYVVNLFLLHYTQNGASFGKIQAFLDSFSFVLRFYGLPNFLDDPMVHVIKKFAEKTCAHLRNAKSAFGSAEVRAIWDSLDEKYGSVEKMPLKEFRTFVMAVFQHQTFCRFSDVAKIKISDLFHEVDYFKIKISSSKTDQAAKGQIVYLPKSDSIFRNPHMLMCIYIQKMGFHNSCDDDLYLFPPLK